MNSKHRTKLISYVIISVDLILSSFNLSGWDNSISVTAKFAISLTQSRWYSLLTYFVGWRGAQICCYQICGLISFLVCLIRHVWWRRWQRSEFTSEPEWLGWGGWRSEWLHRSKWEEKENAWWGFFRFRGQLFKWEGYKKIKVKAEEEVIKGA